MTGGRELRFGHAVVYSALTLATCLVMWVFQTRSNRRIRSGFVALDAKGWLMAALLVAFLGGMLVEGTRWAGMTPYIDPAVLMLVCLVIIPMPLGTLRQALRDILLVTPPDLKEHVDTVARQVVQSHGFIDHRAYVARVGRGRQIELVFIVPPNGPARTVEEWDGLRERISEALGGDEANRWLTIEFTADPDWAN